MARFDHLHVLWQTPDDGTRCVVGELWRDKSRDYAFAYRTDLSSAVRRGFTSLTEFPERRTRESPYRSPYLFATFAQRVPSPKRSDFGHVMEAWGVQQWDDALEILARSGGVQMTDRIELAEYRADDDELVEPLEFRVAGMKYYVGADLSAGQKLALLREPANEHDPKATLVLAAERRAIGHVPRQYSTLVARHLDGGHKLITTAVRRLSLPHDPDRWIVEVRRAD